MWKVCLRLEWFLELIFNFPLDLLSTLILGKLFIYLAFDKTSSSLGIVLFQFMVMELTKYFGFRSSKLNLNHQFDAWNGPMVSVPNVPQPTTTLSAVKPLSPKVVSRSIVDCTTTMKNLVKLPWSLFHRNPFFAPKTESKGLKPTESREILPSGIPGLIHSVFITSTSFQDESALLPLNKKNSHLPLKKIHERLW